MPREVHTTHAAILTDLMSLLHKVEWEFQTSIATMFETHSKLYLELFNGCDNEYLCCHISCWSSWCFAMSLKLINAYEYNITTMYISIWIFSLSGTKTEPHN